MPFAGIDIEYNGRDEQVYRLVWCVRVLTRVCMYNRSYLNRRNTNALTHPIKTSLRS